MRAKKSGWSVTDGKTTRRLNVGWYKQWLCENAYGWHWTGPINRFPYVNLIVLDHEPDAAERNEIIRRFANAKAPDGTKGYTL